MHLFINFLHYYCHIRRHFLAFEVANMLIVLNGCDLQLEMCDIICRCIRSLGRIAFGRYTCGVHWDCVRWGLWPPGRGEICVEPPSQNMELHLAVPCCHLANTNEELCGLVTAIPLFAESLWSLLFDQSTFPVLNLLGWTWSLWELARDAQAKLSLYCHADLSICPSVCLSTRAWVYVALDSSKFCSQTIIGFFPKLVQGTHVWYIFGLFRLFLIN